MFIPVNVTLEIFFKKTHSMGLSDISRVTWQLWTLCPMISFRIMYPKIAVVFAELACYYPLRRQANSLGRCSANERRRYIGSFWLSPYLEWPLKTGMTISVLTAELSWCQLQAMPVSIVIFVQPGNNFPQRKTNHPTTAPPTLLLLLSPCRAFLVRADSRFVPSQWETSLQSNAVSQWLGANLKSAL